MIMFTICSMISIHAPTRGATYRLLIFRADLSHFNPRSHERSDACDDVTALISGKISIHAPTRGATRHCATFGNVRPFQSTLPREERHVIPINGAFTSYFNPRSHERSDNPLSVLCSLAIIFQSTLPREERLNLPKHYII